MDWKKHSRQLNQLRIIGGPYPFIIWGLILLHLLIQIGSLAALLLSVKVPFSMMYWHLTMIASMVAIVIPALRHRRRRSRFIRDHNGHICTSCGYLLTPELDRKPCPECGTPIDLDLYRTQWIQALGGWKQFPPP
jgi:predicted RNA-binding Zn-ribbon protein involved in translation (DUF1610 family)